jgi:Uncharacterized conserved protein
MLGPGGVLAKYQGIQRWLEDTPASALATKMQEAELLFRRIGITFAVYKEGGDPERLIPFDIIPRILDAGEWAYLERGLKQRVRAINAFLHDVYHEREFIRAGGVDAMLILHNEGFRPEMQDFTPPHRPMPMSPASISCARARGVLCPRGQLPHPLGRLLHAGEPRGDDAPAARSLRPASDRPGLQLSGGAEGDAEIGGAGQLRGRPRRRPADPGAFNSAYYEHSFLADEMGIELVEGADLLVEDNIVYMRTTEGLHRVDVIYRRMDDDFLDPLTFRSDSLVGTPGLMNAYRAGNVTLANAWAQESPTTRRSILMCPP